MTDTSEKHTTLCSKCVWTKKLEYKVVESALNLSYRLPRVSTVLSMIPASVCLSHTVLQRGFSLNVFLPTVAGATTSKRGSNKLFTAD